MAKRGIHSVLVEGGATVLDYILSTGIYDEVHVEVSETEVFQGVAAPKWNIRTDLAKNLCIEKYEENTMYIFGA